MRVLIVVGDFSVISGGVTRVVKHLADSLVQLNYSVTIAHTYDNLYHASDADSTFIKDCKAQIFSFKRVGLQKLGYSPDLCQYIKDHICSFDIVHLQGIWDYSLIFCAKIAFKNAIPYVFSPHGMLDTWSLNQNRYFKIIWTKIWRLKYFIENANALILSTNNEVKEVKKNFSIKNYYVVANGIEPKNFAFDKKKSRELLLSHFPDIETTNTIFAFFARIHPKKNPFELLKAFHNLLQTNHKATLLFLGISDDKVLEKKLRNYILSNNISKNIHFSNLVGKEALTALAGSDFFVLPSLQEGFSIAILEALACKIPVVVSEKCNFDSIEEYNAGYFTGTEEKDIKETLLKCIRMDEDNYLKMSDSALKLSSDYSWEAIVQKLIFSYNDILSRSSRKSNTLLTKIND
jgi:glycosyltransferase involved in cell wall biosynthesis